MGSFPVQDPLSPANRTSTNPLFSFHCAHFHFPYALSPLFATLTKTAGVYTNNSHSGIRHSSSVLVACRDPVGAVSPSLSAQAPSSRLAWRPASGGSAACGDSVFSPLLQPFQPLTFNLQPLRPPKSFSCNTYGSPRKCCKQKTYGLAKPFRCNIYKIQGERPTCQQYSYPHLVISLLPYLDSLPSLLLCLAPLQSLRFHAGEE